MILQLDIHKCLGFINHYGLRLKVTQLQSHYDLNATP